MPCLQDGWPARRSTSSRASPTSRPAPARDLRTLPNVILVPHIGSNTVEANRRMALRALRNVQLAHDGDLAALDLINPDVLSRR